MGLEMMSLDDRRARSALLVLVPGVDHVIGTYRRTATADGASVPPHITLLSPFFAPAEITPTIRQRIIQVVTRTPRFRYALTATEQFPAGVMYLKVEPVSPFRTLIAALRREFCEFASYWDQFAEVVPHVTVANVAIAGAGLLTGVAPTLASHLPVHGEVREVVLMHRVRPSPAPWNIQERFPLAAPVTRTMTPRPHGRQRDAAPLGVIARQVPPAEHDHADEDHANQVVALTPPHAATSGLSAR